MQLGSPAVLSSQTSGGGSPMRRYTRRRTRIGALMSASPLLLFSPGPSNNANDAAISLHAFVRLADGLSTAAGLPRPPIRGVLSSLARERSDALEKLLGAAPVTIDPLAGFARCTDLSNVAGSAGIDCSAAAMTRHTGSVSAVVSLEVGCLVARAC